MLESLYIRNFILIDELSVNFHGGFSAFTGETGAGKSILMDAIGLLCGERASAAQVRRGADKAIVEGTFQAEGLLKERLEELGFDEEEVTITREFDAQGKGTCRLNHRVVNVRILRDTIGKAVDIHSQRDHQYLLEPSCHRALLDSFAMDEQNLEAVKSAYEEWSRLAGQLKDLQAMTYAPEREEILRYQLGEIEAAAPKEGEDEELEKKVRVMSSYEKIYASLQKVIADLDGDDGALARLYDAVKTASSLKEAEEVVRTAESMESQYYELSDQLDSLKAYLGSMEMDEGELDRMNARLYQLSALKRKYGVTIADVLEKKQKIEEELNALSNREEVLARKQREVDEALARYQAQAGRLRELRVRKAGQLEKQVLSQLRSLELPHARFSIRITDSAPSAHGSDDVRFYVSMNAGQDLRPLEKAASGGELSRVMLGLKTVFTSLWGTSLIIFDEIDAGVSGQVAFRIGEKMHDIAGRAQVFSVTHLAPVACWADHHYRVVKKTSRSRTFTDVVELDRKQRVEELATINTGEVTPASEKAAAELLERAGK